MLRWVDYTCSGYFSPDHQSRRTRWKDPPCTPKWSWSSSRDTPRRPLSYWQRPCTSLRLPRSSQWELRERPNRLRAQITLQINTINNTNHANTYKMHKKNPQNVQASLSVRRRRLIIHRVFTNFTEFPLVAVRTNTVVAAGSSDARASVLTGIGLARRRRHWCRQDTHHVQVQSSWVAKKTGHPKCFFF